MLAQRGINDLLCPVPIDGTGRLGSMLRGGTGAVPFMLGLVLECLRSLAKILSEVPCVSMLALMFIPPVLPHSGDEFSLEPSELFSTP